MFTFHPISFIFPSTRTLPQFLFAPCLHPLPHCSMNFFRGLSKKAKIGTICLVSYSSFEAYMHFRTKVLIKNRIAGIERTQADPKVQDLRDHKDLKEDRFKSAIVNNFFVNPFEEYRPQTAFEFLLVRVVEFAESFYANKIEIHDKFPTPEGDFAEVGDLLKTFRPNCELMRENSLLLRRCMITGNYTPMREGKSFRKGNVEDYTPVEDQMLFTWLGQSCCLVQVGGINILTDPIFSDHLLSKNIGPKRLVKSPMSVQDVKEATGDHIDVVLVSHNHPDHLDLDAVKEIGNSATWFVPLGLKSTLGRKGIYNVVEMDWWDTISLNTFIEGRSKNPLPQNYEILCVPSMHWSGRHVVDSNRSLWGSFILRRNGESLLYHVGDTGYCKDLFDVIGERFGPIKLLLLPIGQYCPSWHQSPRHISPQESIEVASQVGSSMIFGIHFGTFKLSSEPILEPKNKLLELAETLDNDQYKVPEFGLTYVYDLNSIKPVLNFR